MFSEWLKEVSAKEDLNLELNESEAGNELLKTKK